jgi:hypothetical protein
MFRPNWPSSGVLGVFYFDVTDASRGAVQVMLRLAFVSKAAYTLGEPSV